MPVFHQPIEWEDEWRYLLGEHSRIEHDIAHHRIGFPTFTDQ